MAELHGDTFYISKVEGYLIHQLAIPVRVCLLDVESPKQNVPVELNRSESV